MLQKQQIIIQHHNLGKSQREIHRQSGISRKTIRRYIREYEQELKISQHDDSSGINSETPKTVFSTKFIVAPKRLNDESLSTAQSYILYIGTIN